MTNRRTGAGPLIAGAGGTLLLAALFLPWASVDGLGQSGWQVATIGAPILLTAGLVAIAAAITGGRVGFFRADVSLIGAADLFGVVSAVLLGWLLLFDFPPGAAREIGALLALGGSVLIFSGAGDYSALRGAPLFPRASGEDPRTV